MKRDFQNRKQERLDTLMTILLRQKSATISDLARDLGVSHMTVRRDMELLSASGKVRLFHGGVALADHTPGGAATDYNLNRAEGTERQSKESIARYAASLIRDGDVVFFDGGSTVELILDYLDADTTIAAVCYTYNVLTRLLQRQSEAITMLGGTFYVSSNSFVSPESIQLLKRVRITRAFLSANAVQPDLGVTCSNQFEIDVKRTAIESSLEQYLLVDSTKFGNVFSSYFAAVNEFNTIITDDRRPAADYAIYNDRGIGIIRVPVGDQ